MSSTLANWTFESTAPTTAGPFAAETTIVGATSAATGHHASGSAVYSSPVGNGSSHSFSSNFWSTGDYYQFEVNAGSSSYTLDTLTFAQTSSGTGPTSFKVQYSTNGTTFTDLASGAYTVGTTSWSSGTANTPSNHTISIASVPTGSDLFIRLVDTSSTGATAGTDRIDNVVITANPASAGSPHMDSLTASPNPVLVGASTTLTANNVQEQGGTGSIAGVNFYAESNGVSGLQTTGATPDTLIGAGTASGNNYSIGITAPGTTGSYSYYAVASDNNSPVTTATATTSLTVTTGATINFSTATYTAVNETDGTATITVTLDAPASVPASVDYATSDGTHFADSGRPDVDGSAVAGRDYTSTSGTLNFAVGDTSKTFTVPLLNVKTFSGTRTLNLTLSNATGGVVGTTSTAVLPIIDTAPTPANGTDTPTGKTSFSAELGASGATQLNGFLAVDPNTSNTFTGGPTAPFLEFSPSSTTAGDFAFPTTYATSTVDSIKLSLYNTALTGGFGGIPGSFDVYLLTGDGDAAGATPAYSYGGGNGNTGPSVIGSQGTPLLVGTATFTNNAVGYNDFIFDNLSAGVQTALTNALNNRTAPIRFAITPSAGSPVAADWEGNYTGQEGEQPVLTLLAEKSSAVVENFKLDSSAVTVNKNGTATITVDRSGTDLSDNAKVFLTTANGTASSPTDFTGLSNQEVDFVGNQTQATFTINIANTAISADKTFTVSLSSPSVDGAGHLASLTSPTVETITIHDPRTINGSDQAITTNRITAAGSLGSQYFDVEGTGSGTNASFSVGDFSFPYAPPTGITIGTVNSISLGTVNHSASFTASGPVDIYLVSDTTTDVSGTAVVFDGSTEGVGNQLGTKLLLGTLNFSSTQSTTGYTFTTLSNSDPAAIAALVNDWNTQTAYRIVATPENSTVSATWSGVGDNLFIPGVTPTPVLAFNYTYDSGTFALDSNTASVNEDAGTVTVTVDRTGGTTGAVDVNYHTSDGTATAGSDYTGVPSGVVHFADGQLTATITVAITDDSVHEPDETFGVTLDSITPTATTGQAVLGATTFSTVTIVDNDAATLPSWVSPDSVATFDGTTLTVTGQTSIIADPGYAGAIVVDGASAHLDVTAAAGPNVHINGLTVQNGGKVDVDDTSMNDHNTTLVINGPMSVDTATNSVLDLWNNDMLIKNGSYSDVNTLLNSGSDFGVWDAVGLRSSSAAAVTNKGLGMLTGDEYLNNNFDTPDGTFHGEAVASGDLVIKYTYYGDENLDGHVNDDDLGIFIGAYTGSQTGGWLAGDFTYDSQVNDDDFGLMLPNYINGV